MNIRAVEDISTLYSLIFYKQQQEPTDMHSCKARVTLMPPSDPKRMYGNSSWKSKLLLLQQ